MSNFIANEIVTRKLEELIPYARNSRTHSDAQVATLAGMIREYGFTQPLLIDGENGIKAGHGRLLAARKLGMEEVPCIVIDHLSPVQLRALVIADNRAAELAGWDEDILNIELGDLQALDFDLGVIGFDDWELDLDLGDEEDEPELNGDPEKYSKKVDSPIYEITGENPKIPELFNAEKTESLIQRIESSSLDEETKRFLTLAAYRHTVFDYTKIAERYAHATAEEQQMFEDSALVIIDFEKAIENGYVKLTEDMRSAYLKNKEIRNV